MFPSAAPPIFYNTTLSPLPAPTDIPTATPTTTPTMIIAPVLQVTQVCATFF